MDLISVFAKIGFTFVLSALFGLERQRAHKPIGVPTFTCVSVGACALAITVLGLNLQNNAAILSGVVSGIGFLGAGALIRTTDKIFGFTTAASVWAFAIFGLIVGLGNYIVALTMYTTIWIVVLVDGLIERSGLILHQEKLVITANRMIHDYELRHLFRSCHIHKHRFLHVDIDKKNNRISATYLLEGRPKDFSKLAYHLHDQEWFDSCVIE